MEIAEPFVAFTELERMGRLGNQLFQIAATMGIAHQYGMRAVFPRWRYRQLFLGPSPEIEPAVSAASTYLEPTFRFQMPELSGSTNLVGFFQSEKYFHSIAPQIRTMLTPQSEILNICRDQLSQFGAVQTCAVHVRRGDYVGNPDFVDLAATDYYEKAMLSFGPRTRFLLFSDDLDFCRKRFKDPRVAFVNSGHEVLEMTMMSLCDANIIANSSFSWWGAWLSPNQRKRIVAPHRWFAGRHTDPSVAFSPGKPYSGYLDTSDLLPLTWTRM
jgi:hypothetical protein